jgi:hypothetical protein
MKNRIFTQLTLIVAVLALTAVGEEKSLSLKDTKWKLVGFVDTETEKLEETDYSIYGRNGFPTPPDLNTDDWFTLEFQPSNDYIGKLTLQKIYGSYIVDYARSTVDLRNLTVIGMEDGTYDGPRYYFALPGSHTFELTKTSLKIYYSEGKEYLLFNPWKPATSKVLDSDRIVHQPLPSGSGSEITTAILPPEIILSPTAIAAGPNPVSKSAGLINFYRVGKQVKSASLKIYDASGKTINKLAISDKSAAQSQSKRQIGSWNLKDAKDRPVSEGTYLVKGTVKTVGGRSEKISLLISVR